MAWPKGAVRPPMSEETREKIRAAKLAHWKDPEYRERMTQHLAAGRESDNFKNSLRGNRPGFRHTAESKALMSARMKESRAKETPEVRSARLRGRVLSAETRAKISASHMGIKHTPESRAKISATKQRNPAVVSPERRAALSAQFRGRPAQYPKRRFYYKDVAFRSSWEVVAAKAMDALGITWEYESKRFDLGTQTYAPDFYLPDDGAFWEVKGYFGPKSQKTIELFRKQYPEIPLVLLTERGLRLLESAASTRALAA
jgi:hypothetical protein